MSVLGCVLLFFGFQCLTERIGIIGPALVTAGFYLVVAGSA